MTTSTLTVTAPPVPPSTALTYLLAEGATGMFFDTDILLANPNAAPAPITIRFLKDDGTTIVQDHVLTPMSRTTIEVDAIAGLEGTSVSTEVTSTQGLPLAVERTMRWDATGYGAHTEKAIEGPTSERYFAEGSQGYFSTYLLLANPHAADNAAHVTYFRESEPALTRDYPLLPSSRRTIDLSVDTELVNRSFGVRVTFDRPGMAERAMYFGAAPLWNGGHGSAGVPEPSTSWYLAEGATGSYFSTFLLIANPNDEAATVTVTYLPTSTPALTKNYTLAGNRRLTLNIAAEHPKLENEAVGTRVVSDRPVVVERAQYWPKPIWTEAHSSAGVVSAGTRWALAEGRVGGPHNHQTYILLANPGEDTATVTLTLLRTNGTPIVKTVSVAAASRITVGINGSGSDVPELANEDFGARIESTHPIVAERSMYSDANGAMWAAGTNATATRLP